MTSAGRLRRVGEVAREEGARGLWWRSLSATAYRRLVIAAREIDTDAPPVEPRIAVDRSLLTLDDVGEYRKLRPDTPAAEVERRLRAGQRCLIYHHEGEPVAGGWFTSEAAEIDYLQLSFELSPELAYYYDLYTAPPFRGNRIIRDAQQFTEGLLRDEGVRRLLGTFMPENISGAEVVTIAGYRPVGVMGCVRLPGLRLPVRRLRPGYLGHASRLRRASDD